MKSARRSDNRRQRDVKHPAGSNVGNGSAVLASPATSQKAINGDYLLTCTLEQQDAGKFSVHTPDGREVGPLTVGVLR